MGPLSPEEVARRALAAWQTRDLDAAIPYYSEDVVYDCSERILNPDVYVGHDELRRLSGEIDTDWGAFDIVVDEVIEVDEERVILLMTSRARGRASGIELVDTKAGTLFTVRDGQIVHAKLFPDRRDAFREAGIPHPDG